MLLVTTRTLRGETRRCVIRMPIKVLFRLYVNYFQSMLSYSYRDFLNKTNHICALNSVSKIIADDIVFALLVLVFLSFDWRETFRTNYR